ncbi:MAG: TetR/AcrR family transcriptional regulator [Acidimicrobiia bacterium]
MTTARRPAAPRLPPDERRRQLLDVACVEFADRGFYATAMDDLALAAGVTKPGFYQHFPSLRALFIAVLEDVGSRLLDELTRATSGVETGRARVEEGFRAYFDFVENDPAAFRLLFGASARNDAEFADVVDGVLTDAAAAVSTLIEIHGSPEHRLVLAHAIVGMAEGISRHALTDPAGPHDPEQLAHWVAELAWFGLRGVRAED